MDDLLKDLLVTTYGAIIAALLQALLDKRKEGREKRGEDQQKEKTPKRPGKHFKRS